MSDAQREIVDSLKRMSRTMDEISKTFKDMGREQAKARHPSSLVRRFPDMKLVPRDDTPKDLAEPASVEIDWVNPSIRGQAFFKIDDADAVHIDIVVNMLDKERVLELIEAGFAKKLSLTSWE